MKNKPESSELMKLIGSLAIPRKAGSSGDKEIREFILKEWSSPEDSSKKLPEVTEQMFAYPASAPEVLKALFILGFVIVLFLNAHFILGENEFPLPYFLASIFPISILLALAAGTRWNGIIEKFYSYKEKNMLETSNIIASINANAEETIVFTAHYDSKSQSTDILTRMLMVGFCAASSGVIAVYSLYYLFFLKPALNTLPVILNLRILQMNLVFLILTWGITLIMIILFFTGSDNTSPGALDNASGLAVLMELARYFAVNPPEKVNLRFIATGAEEDGLVGMVKNLESGDNKYIKGKTAFVNLDCVGGTGVIKIIDSYGIPPVFTSRKLSGRLKTIARELDIRAKSVYSPAGAGYDSIPAAYRGFESVTLACCRLFGELSRIHSDEDVVDIINASSMEKTFSLCKHLVETYE